MTFIPRRVTHFCKHVCKIAIGGLIKEKIYGAEVNAKTAHLPQHINMAKRCVNPSVPQAYPVRVAAMITACWFDS